MPASQVAGHLLATGRRRAAAGVVAGLVVSFAVSAACTDANERATDAPTATQSSATTSQAARTEERAAADFRILVCDALYALYGRADGRGFALAIVRANYLWDGVLSPTSQRALTPHYEYLAALIQAAADSEATAPWQRLDSALNNADPHFVPVCKATGVPP